MNSRLFRRVFGAVMVMLAPAFFCAGCDGSGPGEVDDLWYHLFDTEYSWVIEATPSYFTTETPIDITVTVRPKESGIGCFSFIGENPDNGADGEMLSPVAGDVGTVVAPVTYVAGQPTTLTWRIQLNEANFSSSYDSVGFQLYAGFDSVMVDSTMYPLGAPELAARFGQDFISGFSRMLNLDPPEE